MKDDNYPNGTFPLKYIDIGPKIYINLSSLFEYLSEFEENCSLKEHKDSITAFKNNLKTVEKQIKGNQILEDMFKKDSCEDFF